MSCAELISHDYDDHRVQTVESHTPLMTTCTYCGHIFPSKNELDTYILSMDKKNKLCVCPICNYRSTSEGDMTNHVEEHHVSKCKKNSTECPS